MTTLLQAHTRSDISASVRFTTHASRLSHLQSARDAFDALFRRMVTRARAAVEVWRARRRMDRFSRDLAVLDDRTLHDIGLHRDEIASVAAELTGRAERTRIQVRTSTGVFH